MANSFLFSILRLKVAQVALYLATLIDVGDTLDIDGKKTMAITFQQQLLMHSHLVFWLNSYHATQETLQEHCFSNSNEQNCICICGRSKFYQNTDTPLLRAVLEEDIQHQEERC